MNTSNLNEEIFFDFAELEENFEIGAGYQDLNIPDTQMVQKIAAMLESYKEEMHKMQESNNQMMDLFLKKINSIDKKMEQVLQH